MVGPCGLLSKLLRVVSETSRIVSWLKQIRSAHRNTEYRGQSCVLLTVYLGEAYLVIYSPASRVKFSAFFKGCFLLLWPPVASFVLLAFCWETFMERLLCTKQCVRYRAVTITQS